MRIAKEHYFNEIILNEVRSESEANQNHPFKGWFVLPYKGTLPTASQGAGFHVVQT